MWGHMWSLHSCKIINMSALTGQRTRCKFVLNVPLKTVHRSTDEGVLFVGSPYQNTGNWRIFNNGVEE